MPERYTDDRPRLDLHVPGVHPDAVADLERLAAAKRGWTLADAIEQCVDLVQEVQEIAREARARGEDPAVDLVRLLRDHGLWLGALTEAEPPPPQQLVEHPVVADGLAAELLALADEGEREERRQEQ